MQMGMIFFASVSGGIYFHEFDKFEGRHVPPYIVGNVLMFGGIALLTPNDIFNTPKDVELPALVHDPEADRPDAPTEAPARQHR